MTILMMLGVPALGPAGATRLTCALAVLLAQPTVAAPRVDQDACRPSPLRDDRLTALAPRGEFVLASGARAILAGLHWPDGEADAKAAEMWLLRFRDRAMTVSSRGGEDRWGRVQVDAVVDPASDADEPLDLAAGLIEAGLAAVDAGERDRLCRSDLLAYEARARAAGLGIWQRAPVRDARDAQALSGLAGRFVVARGRVLAIGERSARTYLDFARRGESGLTVTVPKRTWRILQERGLTAQALRGRSVQVRGVVEVRRGPTLDVVSADMIEVLDSEVAEKGEAARTR